MTAPKITKMTRIQRRHLLLSGAAALPALAFLSGPVLAAEPEIYNVDGIALGGTDPVGYFTDGKPVAGDTAHELVWMGATWRFASAENRASFEANPKGYAPRYGGYCAYAVSKGATAPTDPEAWTIVDGRLYLNFSTDVRAVWKQDVPGNIAKADKNWPAVLTR